MTYNELMIGDWVNYDSKNYKVAAIHKQYVLLSSDNIEDYAIQFKEIQYDELKPVPLSEPILYQNGWDKDFDKKVYMVKNDLGKDGKNCWMMWSTDEHNLDIQRQDEKLDMYNLKVQRVVIPCDYVHELQHAYRICGITEEIDLEK